MTEKEFRSHFDTIRCSETFCQKMELLLSEQPVPVVFADTAEGVIQMKQRNFKAIAGIAACLLLVIGSAAGMALYGRMQQPMHPTPIETTNTEPTETTESFVYPFLTETIPVNTTYGIADSTQLVTVPASESTTVYTDTTAETQTASQTQWHTMLTTTTTEPVVTASPAETTTTARIETTTSTSATTTASPAATTTTATTTTTYGTTTSYEWGWWYSTTYSETTTTMYHDWAVIVDYDRTPMKVGETRAVEYYHPWYRGEPLEITIVSCTSNVIYEIDSANNMIYVTALEPGNVSICVRGRGAMFDSYVSLTIEDGQIDADYGTALDYDDSPMKVGETREIRYYHPAKPNSIVGCWSTDEGTDNISSELDETRGVVYVTALAPGNAKIYIGADGCAFGSYAYLTIEE